VLTFEKSNNDANGSFSIFLSKLRDLKKKKTFFLQKKVIFLFCYRAYQTNKNILKLNQFSFKEKEKVAQNKKVLIQKEKLFFLITIFNF
jgi:hypothetical protein